MRVREPLDASSVVWTEHGDAVGCNSLAHSQLRSPELFLLLFIWFQRLYQEGGVMKDDEVPTKLHQYEKKKKRFRVSEKLSFHVILV